VAVLALGDSPNDLPLLHAGDRSIVVPGVNGPHPALQSGLVEGRFQLAPAPHAHGWSAAVEQWLPGLLDDLDQVD
jgi:mannosyl-3-phosphoglycerate phosphatase